MGEGRDVQPRSSGRSRSGSGPGAAAVNGYVAEFVCNYLELHESNIIKCLILKHISIMCNIYEREIVRISC